MVQNPRTFSRLHEAEYKEVDLRDNLESMLALARPEIKENRIDVVLQLADLPPVECYPAGLNQLFMNRPRADAARQAAHCPVPAPLSHAVRRRRPRACHENSVLRRAIGANRPFEVERAGRWSPAFEFVLPFCDPCIRLNAPSVASRQDTAARHLGQRLR